MFVAEDERRPHNTHVLLITTGSVASIKAPLIVQELLSVRLNPLVGRAANSRGTFLHHGVHELQRSSMTT